MFSSYIGIEKFLEKKWTVKKNQQQNSLDFLEEIAEAQCIKIFIILAQWTISFKKLNNFKECYKIK